MPLAIYIRIETIDALAIGLAILIFGGILAALFFYLRTAYREGGWQRVRREFVIAIAAIAAFVVIRIIQHHQIEHLKRAVNSLFHR